MRKLRRLPWRIPKSHEQKQTFTPAEPLPQQEPERPTPRAVPTTQPVAFAGGRYVYGDAPAVSCTTEIRHKAKHRVVPA
jgi:hypothetical protein